MKAFGSLLGLALLGLGTLVSGCYDKMFAPVICNGYPDSVVVECSFSGGRNATATVRPRSAMTQREEGLVLKSVTVSKKGRIIAEYGEQALSEHEVSGERSQFWLVDTNGLTRLSKDAFLSWCRHADDQW